MSDYSAFNNIASGVATSVMAILAALGLRTWRKQLLGTTEYELARRLLRAVYRVRDEVARFRSPLMSGGETTAAVKASGEALPDDFEKASRRSYEISYEARWRRLVDVLSDFDAELVEAEVLWGAQSIESAKLLRAATSKLSVATRAHLKSRTRVPRGEKESERLWKQELVVFSGGDETGRDEFEEEMNAVVVAFETLLRPKLSH